MTIQDFMIEAERKAAAYFAGKGRVDVRLQRSEVVKANDSRLHSLTISKEGENIGRAVYLDDLYKRYESGEDAEEVFKEVAERCEASLVYEGPKIPRAEELDLDSIRPRLTLRLLGSMNNISYMNDRPYIDAGNGLIMVAVINSDQSVMSEWAISVTNDLLKNVIGCDKETILTAAMENTQRLEPPLLVNLTDHIFSHYAEPCANPNYLEEDAPDPGKLSSAFMLTNSSTFQGAVALFYPGVMEHIADVLGCGYYVLPSSIHELIIVPDSMEPDIELMKKAVLEANATVVEHKDLLSDNVFHYSAADKCLRTVRDTKEAT